VVPSNARPRLLFLDGLRGLAALYVVLHHAYFSVAWNGGGVSPWLLHLTQWMAHGTFAVDLFIVLSGFCLMLPLLGAPDRQLAGGILGFVRRRARRILPPYYAAIALCLLTIYLVPPLQHRSGDLWDHSLPAFTPAVLLSHLLLVHNFSIHWIWRIDSPAWSIATEWQIYFVFALVLVPTWRRFGIVTAVALAFVIGNVVEAMMPASNEACFYFTGLFGLGMGAAALYHSPNKARWVPWNAAAAGMAAVIGLAMFVFPTWTHRPKIEVDLAVGFTSAVALVALARSTLSARRLPIIVLLESRPAVTLGRFSYSLYLIHFPLLAWSHLWLRRFNFPPDIDLACMLLISVPLAVAASYGFYLLFEWPFQRTSQFSGRLNGVTKAGLGEIGRVSPMLATAR
jgi:peptidoglycan/LPS O-acetylase OafA/YrhL